MLRGYRLLKKTGQIDRISRLKQELKDQKFSLTNKGFLVYLIGSGHSYSETVVRQYLLIRIGGLDLNKALLYATGKKGGKVIYPLPKEWRDTLEEYGFSIGRYRAAILWQFYIVYIWLFGVYRLLKVFFRNLTINDTNEYFKKYIFFAGLSPNNISKIDDKIEQFNIVSWWMQWPKKNIEIDTLFHSVSSRPPFLFNDIDIKYSPCFLPKFKGFISQIKYIVHACCEALCSLINFLFGSWHNAFMLNQYADLLHAQLVNPEDLAREYFFHHSDWIYRPLWTYEAERKGSRIFMYFYSTNCEVLKHKKSDDSNPINLYKGMSWPNYLVWDHYQAEFLVKTLGHNVKYEIVGQIWFSDDENEVPELPENSVIVFDVQPYRSSVYQPQCIEFEYYVPKVTTQFIQDIYDVLVINNLNMVLKRKRDVGYKLSKSYSKILEHLEYERSFIAVNPNISAFRLIEKSKIVISMPYTSTAHIAKNYGLSSIYYDPSGLLVKNDPGSHGIPLISGKDELIVWFENYFNRINGNN